ncbi:MAG: S8 family serine peptidase, partial [Phycisphaerales bacterium]|nr:S8 family serine peptidase [Phycisphaerales bacterium]
GYAGIIAAERTADPTDLHGVAPGAGVASLFRGPSRLRESQAYEWESQRLDIKVHELVSEYTTQGFSSDLIPGGQNEFVFDSFKNSVKFGRGRKGTIHIFGSGFNVGLQPDPYNYGTPYVWDVVSANPNLLGVSLTNGFLTQTLGALGAAPVDAVRTSAPVTLEQFYITSQTHYYALANDRDSLIINTVGEDGNLDLFSPIGPGVFASVYAGTNNGVFSGNQAAPNGSGRGVLTIGPFGATNVEIPPPLLAGVGGNQSAAMTAAGIVALMLEANPNLTPRDIQHIFFRSIQESTKPGATKWPNYDFVNNRLYYTPFAPPSVLRDFWQVNNGFYNNPDLVPPIVNQSIRHSDQYGFGIIDANAAIQMARTWNGAPPLIRLDSGLVGDLGLGGGGDDDDVPGIPFEPIAIADATFTDPDPEPDGAVPPVTGQSSLVVGPGLNQFRFCVRDNIQIENIVVELTVSGAGSNDLYVTLTSPTGTSSNLVLPTTSNISGMTEGPGNDELEGFTANTVNGTTYAYFQHPILTHKHWGELSGGYWTLDFYDFGPDVENPAGVPTGDDPAMEPGADTVVNLGEIGVPGSTIREAKTVTALRIEIFGTDTNVLPFLGCDPFATSCPADLNADGRIDVVDLQLFLNWYQNGDIRADINSDGQLDFGDIQTYLGIFQPGFCTNGSTPPFSG